MADIVSIGDAAAEVVDKIRQRMEFWEAAGALAAFARSRNVTISIIERGLVVASGSKSEIITFANAESGIIERAIERIGTPVG